jgi:hypothetical protein
MKAFLIFSETEPVLVMASRSAAADGRLASGLEKKGFEKYIAYEVPLSQLRKQYGVPFEVIEADVKNGKDVRILDSKGSRVLENVRFSDLGSVFCHDIPGVM